MAWSRPAVDDAAGPPATVRPTENTMTDDDSPLATLFELQRNTIRQTEDALESALEVPADVSDTLYGGIDTQREVQRQVLGMTRQSIHTSLDAAESVTTSSATLDDLRESVDQAFDTLEEQQAEAFDAVDEEYESLSEGYEEFSDDAADSLKEQLDVLVEFNEGVEEQLTETVEEFTEQLDELESELEGQTEETQERVAEQAEELAERYEEQLDELSDRFEEQAERFDELEARIEDVGIDIGNGDRTSE
ncbi:hypothetical protein BRC75_02970 [Halobacteriales archaeon QH_7_69_31]|nr:MAG: hypothetical protein BRC75_02970 [Halobacteriales archaeon QH_7_69_31]